MFEFVVVFLGLLPILPALPILPLVSGSNVLEESAGSQQMFKKSQKNPTVSPIRNGTAAAAARAATLAGAMSRYFEKLEDRMLFDGTTVVDELAGGSSGNAGYVVDLAAGKQTTPPAAPARPAPSPAPKVAATASSTSGAGQADSGATGTEPPATTTAAPLKQSDLKSGADPIIRQVSDFRYVLRPGTGWTGPTTQPAAVGNPTDAGYDAKAIARWDVVPYQTFDGMFNVGVVAFHREGINRVEFSVNGGDWTRVRQMTLNPQTDVYEYTATLRAADFADGAVELRAAVFPTVGIPRILQGSLAQTNGEQSLSLYSNANGSLTSPVVYVGNVTSADTNPGTLQQPFATLSKALDVVQDGGQIIIVNAGSYPVDLSTSRYAFGRNNIQRWITIKPADGLTRDQVTIRPVNRSSVVTKVNRLHWENLTFDFHTISQYSLEANHQVWFDRCRWYDSAGWGASYPSYISPVSTDAAPKGSYVTDSLVEDMFYGFVSQAMVRNCQLNRISSDALQNSQLILNASVDTINGSIIPEAHADVLQLFGQHENVIAYGLHAVNIVDTQDLFLDKTGSTFTNMAFVDLTFDNAVPNVPPFSQMSSANSHVIYENVRWNNQRMFFRTDFVAPGKYTAINVVFRSCMLTQLTWSDYVLGPAPAGVRFEDCSIAP